MKCIHLLEFKLDSTFVSTFLVGILSEKPTTAEVLMNSRIILNPILKYFFSNSLKRKNQDKVYIFWEGHNNLKKNPPTFDLTDKTFCTNFKWKRLMCLRGVSSFLKLGGQVVMRCAAATAAALLNCQKLGGQLPTLPTRQLRPCVKHKEDGWFLNVLWPSQNMWTLVVQDLKLNYCYHLGKQGLIERLLISFSVAGLIKQRSLRQTLGKLEKEKFHSLHPSNEGSWSEPIFCTHLKIKLDSLGWLFLREYFRPSRIMKECEF